MLLRMEQPKSTAELLEAWRNATRAADLADSLAANALAISDTAEATASAAEEIAILAEEAAVAAERAANSARDAARRAQELARSNRELRDAGGDHAKDAHAADDVSRDAYHARVTDAARETTTGDS